MNTRSTSIKAAISTLRLFQSVRNFLAIYLDPCFSFRLLTKVTLGNNEKCCSLISSYDPVQRECNIGGFRTWEFLWWLAFSNSHVLISIHCKLRCDALWVKAKCTASARNITNMIGLYSSMLPSFSLVMYQRGITHITTPPCNFNIYSHHTC